jgi:hypothetical protein
MDLLGAEAAVIKAQVFAAVGAFI